MNNELICTRLQQLLDERWPITDETNSDRRAHWGRNREIFTEGYNARIAEENSSGLTNREVLERDYNPSQDHSDFHTIK